MYSRAKGIYFILYITIFSKKDIRSSPLSTYIYKEDIISINLISKYYFFI
jgi:hypothetical protein